MPVLEFIAADALKKLAEGYGFHGGMDEACVKKCKEHVHIVVKQIVKTALFHADNKRQQTITQEDHMSFVRKRMKMCAWKEETE
ncbi:MAG: hypothetical protein K2Q45_06560 [Nitrosomonas sp.]|nr:hypothetical protein [Nitrosomonas sp.]